MSKNWRGDTIVEVLLAITIAAFGIGTTYATAQRGLDQTITARERSEALNLIQNQITNLQLLYQSNPADFAKTFGSPVDHFCLTNTATAPIPNNFTSTNTVDTLQNPPYNTNGCILQKTGDGVAYYIDITTPSGTIDPTLYQVSARWYPIGGGQINQASNFFRVNGGTAVNLGSSAAQSCSTQYRDVAMVADTSSSMDQPLPGDPITKEQALKNAANTLVSSIGPAAGQNLAGLVDFWTVSPGFVNQPLTSSTATLSSAISRLSPHPHNLTGQTNFTAGLTGGGGILNGAGALPANSKIMVFMTDGSNSSSLPGNTDQDARNEAASLKASGIVIFTVGIGSISAAGQTLLQDMSGGTSGGVTGGYVNVASAADFSQVLQNLGSRVTCGSGGGGILPPETQLSVNLAVMQWKGYNDPPNLIATENGNTTPFLNCTFNPGGTGDNCPGYSGTYNCNNAITGTSFSDPSVSSNGAWDINEVCSVYHATFLIPTDEASLKTLDFQFTNDDFNFPDTGGRDNNIIIFGLGLPSPHQLHVGSFASCTGNPAAPATDSVISSANVLPLFWENVAYMYVDGNSADGTSSC